MHTYVRTKNLFVCTHHMYIHTCTIILYICMLIRTSKPCTYIHVYTCTYRSAQKIYAGKNRNNSHSTTQYTD